VSGVLDCLPCRLGGCDARFGDIEFLLSMTLCGYKYAPATSGELIVKTIIVWTTK
jgi:hypothetical protein